MSKKKGCPMQSVLESLAKRIKEELPGVPVIIGSVGEGRRCTTCDNTYQPGGCPNCIDVAPAGSYPLWKPKPDIVEESEIPTTIEGMQKAHTRCANKLAAKARECCALNKHITSLTAGFAAQKETTLFWTTKAAESEEAKGKLKEQAVTACQAREKYRVAFHALENKCERQEYYLRGLTKEAFRKQEELIKEAEEALRITEMQRDYNNDVICTMKLEMKASDKALNNVLKRLLKLSEIRPISRATSHKDLAQQFVNDAEFPLKDCISILNLNNLTEEKLVVRSISDGRCYFDNSGKLCDCMQKDGADPEKVGYPSYHQGCRCVVEKDAN